MKSTTMETYTAVLLSMLDIAIAWKTDCFILRLQNH